MKSSASREMGVRFFSMNNKISAFRRRRGKCSVVLASFFVALFLVSSLSSLSPIGSSNLSIPELSKSLRTSAQGNVLGGSCVGGTNPSIIVDNSYSNPGGVVTVDGTGFSSCDTAISVSFTGITATPTSSCSVNGGQFICSFIVPEDAGAICYIAAYEQNICALNTDGITATGNTGDSASQPYAIAIGMGIYPASGPVGTTVTVYGDGFFVYDVLADVKFNGAAYVCGDIAGVGCRSPTNPSGEGCLPWKVGTLNNWATCTFTIPQEPLGTYTVHFQSYTFGDIPDGGGYDATFQVTTYSAAASISPEDAPVGASITATASGFPTSDSTADVDLNSVPLQTSSGSYSCPITSGSIDCSVTVSSYWPSGTAVTPGPYSLSVQSFPSGVTTAPITFWVSGSYPLKITPQSAVPGSTITVSGNAFDPSDSSVSIMFNGEGVVSSCPLSSGSFSCQFVLPITTSTGSYDVRATGNSALDTDSAAMTVLPGILTNPLTASPGSLVSVQGIGFSSSDSKVTLELNGTTNVTPSAGCPVSSGSFSCDFTVPQDSGGTYILSATGTSGDSYSTGFIISGEILLEPSNGSPGTNVTIIGSGFSTSDGSIALTFGGSSVTPNSACSATSGSFVCSFLVPQENSGNYTVGAAGSTGDSFSAIFSIVPSISLSQTVLDPAEKGSTIAVQGSGFYASDTSVSLTLFGLAFGGNDVTPSAGCSVSGGTFDCSFTLPSPYSAGSYTLEATGNSLGDKANASLTEVGQVSASPSIVLANSSREIDVIGTGFTYYDYHVSVQVDGLALPGSQFCQISFGGFNCELPVPHTIIPGYYQLVAIGNYGDVATSTIAIFGISTSVTFGQANEQITVTGGAFSTSDTQVSLKFGTIGITPSGGCPVFGGAFKCEANVPSSLVGGNYSITAIGNSDQDSASTTFDLLTIELSTTSGPLGSYVTFSGAGFGESLGGSQMQSIVQISVLFQGVNVAPYTTTSSTGHFQGSFYVPLSQVNNIITFSDPIGENISTSFQINNVNSYDEIQTTFLGGAASASSSITGMRVSIAGSSASDGSAISIQTASLSSYPFTPTPQFLLDTGYYAISWPQSSLPNTGNALVCAPDTNSANSLEYLSINFTTGGETWAPASAVTVAAGQICGNIPVSSIEYSPGGVSEVGYVATGVGLSSTTTDLSCIDQTLIGTSSTSCEASVSGASGSLSGETMTFSRISGSGNVTFSSSTCILTSGGACSVRVTGVSEGTATIGAFYPGDSNNLPSSGTFSLTISAVNTGPPPSLVQGNVVWYTPDVHGFQYIYPASVAINGKQFSALFYESLFAQYELVPGSPYAGYYSGTFGAVSGCQPGSSITVTATVDGVTQSATGACPSIGTISGISLVFGSPPRSSPANSGRDVRSVIVHLTQRSNAGNGSWLSQVVNSWRNDTIPTPSLVANTAWSDRLGGLLH
jgi:hypothetical protein